MNSISAIEFDAVTCATVLARMENDDFVAPQRILEDSQAIAGTGFSRFHGFLVEAELEKFEFEKTLITWRIVSRHRNETGSRALSRQSKESTRARGSDASWVTELYAFSTAEITDDAIGQMFDAIETAVYSDLEALDQVLITLDVTRLAPEFLVGIPRGLYPLRERLANWHALMMRVWHELSRRPGLDVKELMQGLL